METKAIEQCGSFWGSVLELAELATHQARSLGIDAGKINERLIRYYTTEGVISKPDRLGREAAYHYRHLLELLAARRLTQEGASLAAAKSFNSGSSNADLEAALTGSLETQIRTAGQKVNALRLQTTQPKAENGVPEGFALDATFLKIEHQLAHLSEQQNMAVKEMIGSIQEQSYRREDNEKKREAMLYEAMCRLDESRDMSRRMYEGMQEAVHELRNEVLGLRDEFRYLREAMERSLVNLPAQSGQVKL